MRKFSVIAFGSTATVVGGGLAVIATVSYEDAQSNLASWYSGIIKPIIDAGPPAWLSQPNADYLGFVLGVGLVLFGIAVLLYSHAKAKRERPHDARLSFEKNDYYERVTGTTRRFRVGVVNHSGVQLQNVSIRLDDCKDETGTRPRFDMPLGLQREEGLGPAPLSPNSAKHATVVQLDESDPNAPIVIPRISSLKETPRGYELREERLDRSKTYLLTVGAHPTTSAPHQMTFQVWVDASGRLRMEERKRIKITARR